VVVPIGEVDALQDAIEALAPSRTGTQAQGQAARVYILKNHSFPPWQAFMAQIYKQLQTKG
jgi:hypothetical protein